MACQGVCNSIGLHQYDNPSVITSGHYQAACKLPVQSFSVHLTTHTYAPCSMLLKNVSKPIRACLLQTPFKSQRPPACTPSASWPLPHPMLKSPPLLQEALAVVHLHHSCQAAGGQPCGKGGE
jgi:hypothetical protein